MSTFHHVKKSKRQNHMSPHLQNVVASKVIPAPAYKLLMPGDFREEVPKATRLSAKVGPQGVGLRTAESISFSALFAFIAF